MADVVPREDLPGGEHVAVAHSLMGIVLHMLVDIVGDDHIHRGGQLGKLPQLFHNLGQSGGVQPVVGVHHLIVQTLGMPDALVDTLAVAAVLLMDGLDDGGIFGSVLIADGGGVIPGGTIVHQDDLFSLHRKRQTGSAPRRRAGSRCSGAYMPPSCSTGRRR